MPCLNFLHKSTSYIAPTPTARNCLYALPCGVPACLLPCFLFVTGGPIDSRRKCGNPSVGCGITKSTSHRNPTDACRISQYTEIQRWLIIRGNVCMVQVFFPILAEFVRGSPACFGDDLQKWVMCGRPGDDSGWTWQRACSCSLSCVPATVRSSCVQNVGRTHAHPCLQATAHSFYERAGEPSAGSDKKSSTTDYYTTLNFRPELGKDLWDCGDFAIS